MPKVQRARQGGKKAAARAARAARAAGAADKTADTGDTTEEDSEIDCKPRANSKRPLLTNSNSNSTDAGATQRSAAVS